MHVQDRRTTGLHHHFNREYESVFGVLPTRDVQRLRAQDLIATSSMRNDTRNDATFDTDQTSTASRR